MIVGRIVAGGGYHADNSRRLADEFTVACGYTPWPGSLNVRVDTYPDLGEPCVTVKGTGRTYRLWPARIVGYDGPAHVVRPFRRPSRPVVELLAPDRLRDVLDPDVPVQVVMLEC